VRVFQTFRISHFIFLVFPAKIYNSQSIITEVASMKNNKIYLKIVFLSSIVSPLAVYADNVQKAIVALDVDRVKKELTALKVLSESQKQEYKEQIEAKITDAAAQHISKARYLNKDVLTGCCALGLGLYGLQKSNEVMEPVVQAMGKGFFQILKKGKNKNMEPEAFVNYTYAGGLVSGILAWQVGQLFGVLSGVSITVGLYNFFKGITLQKLKADYAKSLAIKQLIVECPTE
jgi:hypothetical protein